SPIFLSYARLRAGCSRARGILVQLVRTMNGANPSGWRRGISAPHASSRGQARDMLDHALIATLHLQVTRSFVAWARRLGGPGLIVLGVIDNSAIPIPGSQDAMTIILAASQKTLWLYYALMATAGALLGGY